MIGLLNGYESHWSFPKLFELLEDGELGLERSLTLSMHPCPLLCCMGLKRSLHLIMHMCLLRGYLGL